MWIVTGNIQKRFGRKIKGRRSVLKSPPPPHRVNENFNLFQENLNLKPQKSYQQLLQGLSQATFRKGWLKKSENCSSSILRGA